MTATPPNPRRAYKTGAFPTFTTHPPTPPRHASPPIASEPDRGLKKSATFHVPKSPATEDDPIVNIPLLSRRSPTSPPALNDALASSEQRVFQLIDSVDRSLSGLESFSIDQEASRSPDEAPVPRFMLAKAVDDPDCMDLDHPKEQQPHHNRHLSDSGIGSSVSSSDSADVRDDAAQILADLRKSIPSLKSVRSGINGTSANKVQHVLSAYACRQIQKYIILPILKEQTLKSFHPLVKGIPTRVGRREITCLRDLEKVLLYLGPRFTESRSAFVRFCETSIQCLHTTIDYLNEADQRRPSDRPYTNSYFLDLTEQVRQYATMISAARERLQACQAKAEDEETINSKLSLEGGLAHSSHPAQLVRTSHGRSISLLDGEEVDLDALREEARRDGYSGLDEETLLSMARRKKNAAERIMHRCAECDKEFKRPCDLTKHEKTHSRPWKCDDSSCKYHTYGWPTEKERDRHMNDKHSAAPAMFKCQYHPCPYESKRESNCKQHMEKAHGWAYVRSKNNGKKGRKPSNATNQTPPTPQSGTPGSEIFKASSSEFGDSVASPYMHMSGSTHTASGSIAGTSPYLSMKDAFTPSPYEPTFTFNNPVNPVLTPPSPYTPASHRLSFDGNAGSSDLVPAYGAPMGQMDVPLFEPDDQFDWSNMNNDLQNFNVQLFTPAPSDGMPAEMSNPSHEKKLSPTAQASLMLYTPQEQPLDDEFGTFAADVVGKPTSDFPLFDESSLEGQAHMNLFETLPPFSSQTWGAPAPQPDLDAQMMEE